VKVRVLEINESLKRISLSMKSLGRPSKPSRRDKKVAPPPPEKKPSSVQDLMAKFNKSK
jgi:uncharacterized protein